MHSNSKRWGKGHEPYPWDYLKQLPLDKERAMRKRHHTLKALSQPNKAQRIELHHLTTLLARLDSLIQQGEATQRPKTSRPPDAPMKIIKLSPKGTNDQSANISTPLDSYTL